MGIGAPYPEMSILFEYDINLFLKRIMTYVFYWLNSCI